MALALDYDTLGYLARFCRPREAALLRRANKTLKTEITAGHVWEAAIRHDLAGYNIQKAYSSQQALLQELTGNSPFWPPSSFPPDVALAWTDALAKRGLLNDPNLLGNRLPQYCSER